MSELRRVSKLLFYRFFSEGVEGKFGARSSSLASD